MNENAISITTLFVIATFIVPAFLVIFFLIYKLLTPILKPYRKTLEEFEQNLGNKDKAEKYGNNLAQKIENIFMLITRDENNIILLFLGSLLCGGISIIGAMSYNTYVKLDTSDFSTVQLILIISLWLVGSGTIYKYDNKFLKTIFSNQSLLIVISIFLLIHGLQIVNEQTTNYYYQKIQGTHAVIIGYFLIAIGFVGNYIALNYSKFEKKIYKIRQLRAK